MEFRWENNKDYRKLYFFMTRYGPHEALRLLI